jgi:hypothetical protein
VIILFYAGCSHVSEIGLAPHSNSIASPGWLPLDSRCLPGLSAEGLSLGLDGYQPSSFSFNIILSQYLVVH